MTKNFKQFNAFTLAEVLITLAIIGVVAAVTMPILIKNYQKTVIKSQFKKAYSTVNQAYNLAFADLGYNSNCHYGKGGSSTGTDCIKLKEAIEKHLNIVKTCRGHIFSEGCVPEYKDQQDLGLPSGCAGTYRSNLEAGSTAYVLQDGTVIFMYPFFAIGYPSLIYVDVNGKKGPNKWGYDVQGLSLYYAEPLPLKLDFIRDNCYVKEEGAYNIKDLLR